MFLVGFAFTFFLQQFHPNFFAHNTAGSPKTNAGLLTAKLARGESSLLSVEPALSTTEMEADEDDDRQNNETEFYSTYTQKYPADRFVCNYISRVRYLQVASSVRQQPWIPFFILHHSWKNHIA